MAQLPLWGAGPNQVRAYLADLLIYKHDASSQSAKSISDLWQLGQGHDLRQANMTNFIDIFGEPAGRYLYRTVTEDFQVEWRASTLGMISFWTSSIACVAAVFFVIRAACVRSDVQVNRSLSLAAFCGPVMLIIGILECLHWGSTFYSIMTWVGFLMTPLAVVAAFYALETWDTSSGARAK
ncbi:hypothetical protein N7481_010203 [Penicillium waksmanii]|uniref:uncharacterized protein n=1 Tax=Penicillium waksmanii TaxID=69791 RepID=UPI002546D710|nr:uncharacterized protein N7481_010203 [Penicillium waksmanii]KAJ5976496.1 hypothetical protein N7481_010203 [Penicillium waksmanii]